VPSGAIRGHQRSSGVIRGHQRSSYVIRGHWRSLEVIGGHWRSLEVIGGHWRSLEVIGGHQRSSEVIRGHWRRFEVIRGHQSLSSGAEPQLRCTQRPSVTLRAHQSSIRRSNCVSFTAPCFTPRVCPRPARSRSCASEAALRGSPMMQPTKLTEPTTGALPRGSPPPLPRWLPR